MNFKISDNMILAVHGDGAPSPERWGGYLAQIQQQGRGLVELCVLLGSGGPTRSQRRERRIVLSDRRLSTAILSDDWTRRLRARIGATLQPEVRVFSRAQIQEALVHLGALTLRWARIKQTIKRLGDEEQIEDTYEGLVAQQPGATHCKDSALCALVAPRVGTCTCTCDGCTLAEVLRHEAHLLVTGREPEDVTSPGGVRNG